MLALLLKPFWNKDQRRVRALWRILIHGLMFVLLTWVLTSLVALVSSSLPDPLVSLLFQAALLISSLITLWLAGKLLDRRPFSSFGFNFSRLWWLDLGFGLFLGALLMALIFLVELGAGWVTVTGTFQTQSSAFYLSILLALVNFIQVGITEEILSRGYHLRNLAEGFRWRWIGPRAALLIGYFISSTMFGLFHLANPNSTWISTFNIALAGLFLGLGFILTKNLALPIGLHITWNFFQGNVFGFPVSGTEAGSSFIAIQQSGPEIWTGGAFGPEAGIIGLLAMGLGFLLILLWVKWQHGQVALQTELAEYQPGGQTRPASEENIDNAAPIRQP
jgi:membrane protease YdiL (CAAX protease family)